MLDKGGGRQQTLFKGKEKDERYQRGEAGRRIRNVSKKGGEKPIMEGSFRGGETTGQTFREKGRAYQQKGAEGRRQPGLSKGKGGAT